MMEGGGGMSGLVHDPSLQAFRSKYPMDDRAFEFLENSKTMVKDRVIREFRPKIEGEADYSALITRFTKACRDSVDQQVAAVHVTPSWRGPPPVNSRNRSRSPLRAPLRGGGGLAPASRYGQDIRDKPGYWATGGRVDRFEADSRLTQFRRRFPMDERAFDFLSSSPLHVQEKVILNFRPNRPDDDEFSAAVTAYVRTCRNAGDNGASRERSYDRGGGYGAAHVEASGTLSAFRDQFPMDDRAFEFLASSPPEVQAKVIEEFRPRSMGDSDYSGAVTSFVKRTRMHLYS